MKIKKMACFKPVTIILETAEETQAFNFIMQFVTDLHIREVFKNFYLSHEKDEPIYDERHWMNFIFSLFHATESK